MATRTDRDGAVPDAVVALVDLLNSRPYANLGDKLDDPARAAEVLRPFGHDGVISAERLGLVRALRSDLLGLVGADDPGAWAALTGRASAVTFLQDFSTPGRVELRQVTGDPVAGRITREVADLVSAGNWSRLRFCANDECQEVFYDTTRSRTRRWHSYEYCGNRTNVAAYRARSAEASRASGA
ncbi:CGNR zinc finger domain-containing protein [Acrocarpospora phusangensis]|nr:CGNR zinc finger domain-containing protein [Acrocarpospora phusangensis]